MTKMVTRQGIRCHGGGLEFGGARLTTGWTWRRGEIRTGQRVWTVTPTDRHRIGSMASVAGAANGPAVRLHPQHSHVPGQGGIVRWRPGHRSGTLTRDGNRIAITLSRRWRGPISLEVSGDWPDLELVVLTAAFALMSRRRLRVLIIAAVVGATGHG